MNPNLEDRASRANAAAALLPVTVDQARAEVPQFPAIQVAGVLLFVYVDTNATVRVSVHCDTADLDTFPEWSQAVPVQIEGAS